jgi:hypothetical protein
MANLPPDFDEKDVVQDYSTAEYERIQQDCNAAQKVLEKSLDRFYQQLNQLPTSLQRLLLTITGLTTGLRSGLRLPWQDNWWPIFRRYIEWGLALNETQLAQEVADLKEALNQIDWGWLELGIPRRPQGDEGPALEQHLRENEVEDYIREERNLPSEQWVREWLQGEVFLVPALHWLFYKWTERDPLLQRTNLEGPIELIMKVWHNVQPKLDTVGQDILTKIETIPFTRWTETEELIGQQIKITVPFEWERMRVDDLARYFGMASMCELRPTPWYQDI